MSRDLQFLALRLYRVSRGLFDRLKWILPRTSGFFLTVTSLSITLTALVSSALTGGVSNFDTGVLFTLSSLIGLVLLIINTLMFFLHRFALVRNGRVAAIKIAVSAPDVVLSNAGQDLWTNTAVNPLIEAAANRIRYQPKPVKIDPLVAMFRNQFVLRLRNERAAAGIDTFDDQKISLRTDITAEHVRQNRDVRLQRTSYFRDRLSNGLINWRVQIDGRPAFDFVDEAFEFIIGADGKPEWRLRGLTNASLANQLGASTILLTGDDRIVYLQQASRSAENSDKLAPSGSGSFDATAIKRNAGASLQELVRTEAKRELCEECGLAVDDIAALQICGFGRYLYRAGKPEFFCIATTRQTSDDIEVPTREWDWQSRLKRADALTSIDRSGSFGAFTASIAKDMRALAASLELNHEMAAPSGPLLWSLELAARYLESADEARLRQLLAPLSPPA